MTVTVDLNPDLEQRIAVRAAARGLSLEAYVLSLIEAAAVPTVGERATLAEFEAAMDALAEGLDNVPVLTPEAVTRESIYGHRA
jgi:plasmid stability protein